MHKVTNSTRALDSEFPVVAEAQMFKNLNNLQDSNPFEFYSKIHSGGINKEWFIISNTTSPANNTISEIPSLQVCNSWRMGLEGISEPENYLSDIKDKKRRIEKKEQKRMNKTFKKYGIM